MLKTGRIFGQPEPEPDIRYIPNICSSPHRGEPLDRSSRNLAARRRPIPTSLLNFVKIGRHLKTLDRTPPLLETEPLNAFLCFYDRKEKRHLCAFCSVLGQKNAYRT